MIRLDCTQLSVVAVCNLCGWRAGATSKPNGWALGARHQDVAHPKIDQARRALEQARRAGRG